MPIRHDVHTRLYLDNGWRDVTDDVLVRDGVTISRGRPDEAAETPPQTCTLTLDNRTGDYSPRNPTGQWFGSIGNYTPIEVCEYLAQDTASAIVVSGWGTTETGTLGILPTYVWTVTGGSAGDYAKSAGKATHSVIAANTSRLSYLAGPAQRDLDVLVTVSVSVTNVTGAPLAFDVIPRYVASLGFSLGARIAISTAEAVSIDIVNESGTSVTDSGPVTIAGITHSSSQALRVRAQSEGQTFRAKVWVATGDEPLDWQVWQTRAPTSAIRYTAGTPAVKSLALTGNTNVPVTFSYDDFVVCSTRFAGEIVNITTGADASNRDRYATVEAAGILRRLTNADAPVQSTLRHELALGGSELLAYWPAEDGKNSTVIASAIGGPHMVITGEPEFEAYDELPASLPLPYMNLSKWEGQVPDHTATGQIQLRFVIVVPTGGTTDDTIIAQMGVQGTATLWQIVYFTGSGGQLALKAYDFGGNLILTGGPAAFTLDGKVSRLSLELTQDGADVDWALSSIRPFEGGGGISGTLAGRTVGIVEAVDFNAEQVMDDVAIGHITVESDVTDIFDAALQLEAYAQERALDRIVRLCAENDVQLGYVNTSTTDTPQLGPQWPLKLLDLLRECATTDGGTLFETKSALALSYRTRAATYAQDATLTLDVDDTEVAHPFQPVEDDQLLANDVEASNVNGSSARVELVDGRLSVNEFPAGVGRHAISFNVNVYDESELPDVASWRLTLGTTDEPRFPDLAVDLDAPSAQQHELATLNLNLDDLVVLEDATLVDVYDDVELVARGYQESLTNHRHVIAINASPYAPYDVEVLDGDARLDSGSSTLNEDLDTTETGVDVATTDVYDLWVTTAANPSEFPFDVIIGGERMTVTAITGATSPQTFTVTRSVNGVIKTHATGDDVHVFRPIRLGL